MPLSTLPTTSSWACQRGEPKFTEKTYGRAVWAVEGEGRDVAAGEEEDEGAVVGEVVEGECLGGGGEGGGGGGEGGEGGGGAAGGEVEDVDADAVRGGGLGGDEERGRLGVGGDGGGGGGGGGGRGETGAG